MNRVFIVDDDYYVRKGLLELIDWIGCGYQICGEADNGEDALELIKEIKPDLVVTDIRMPVLDGLGLIKKVVEEVKSSTSFIIISGYNDFKYAQQAMRYGVHDFILKPIDKEEFEQTLNRLSVELEEGREYEKSRDKRIALSTLGEILAGAIEHTEDHDYIQRLNLKIAKEMRYILIEVNNMTSNMSKIRNKINRQINFITQDENTLIREHSQGCFGVLVTDQQLHLFQGSIKQFTGRLQSTLSTNLNKEISVYVGKTVHYPYKIKDSFNSAKEALQFKYIEPQNKVIFYEDTKVKSVNYIKLEQSFYDPLMENIIENNTEAIVKTLDQMMSQFRENFFALDAVKTTINRCVHDLIRTIKIRDGNEQKLESLRAMLDWNEIPLTLEQVKEVFTEFVLEGAAFIARLNQDNAKGSIHKIKEYIEENYQESLTLRIIADKYYMNSAYLGQLFKKTYGVYFKDYFRQVRINEAKKKLRQTDMRVYEIAESVGFDNPDYFVTQFRKEVGMTPMKYRNKVIANSNENGDKNESFSH